MDSMKIAISVPDEVFKAGEHLARQMGISRSQLYADALSAYLSVRGAAAVTDKLNAVHDLNPVRLDPAFADAQSRLLADEAW
jgi:metal-responsive CopG/Arc/MetJ family transcriptional regulator